jgi:hypothetical protein
MPDPKSTTPLEGQPDSSNSPSAPPNRSTRQPIDERLEIVRQDLETIFTQLLLVLDVTITVHKALLHQNAVQDGDFANVLQRCGSDMLHEHLGELNIVIEELGGETEYSDKLPPELDALLDGTGKNGGDDHVA